MNQFIAVGAAVVGGAIVFQLSKARRRRLAAAINRRMLRHMEQMMASLPESSPPKLVMSILPRLRDQNDRIISMLQEQTALLREHLQRSR